MAQQYPPQADHNYFIVTDGAGYQDGYSGAAAVVMAPQERFMQTRYAGWIGSTVERAEFEALLMGLQCLIECLGDDTKGARARLEAERPRVHWTSDRESLVLAVARDSENEDKPFYRRESTPDLWARFAFYERLFRITPHHKGRNLGMLQRLVDVTSSDMRNLVGGYADDTLRDLYWVDGWNNAWADPVRFNQHLQNFVPQLLQLAAAIKAGDAEQLEPLQTLKMKIISTTGRAMAHCIEYCADCVKAGIRLEDLPTDFKGRVIPLL